MEKLRIAREKTRNNSIHFGPTKIEYPHISSIEENTRDESKVKQMKLTNEQMKDAIQRATDLGFILYC